MDAADLVGQALTSEQTIYLLDKMRLEILKIANKSEMSLDSILKYLGA